MRKRAKGGWKARWSRAGGRAKESKAERIAFPPAAGGQRRTRLRWGRGASSSSSPGMEAEHAGCRAGLLLPLPLRCRAGRFGTLRLEQARAVLISFKIFFFFWLSDPSV